MQENINPLKKINLEQYQKPKTLIVVHYKGKRISIPMLGDCKNLTQMLYYHIDKFQQTVLKSDPKWEVLSGKKIVCFCSSSNSDQSTNKLSKQQNQIRKNIEKYIKFPDGDLKIDILLSMVRIQNNGISSTLDITKYYKYMEIQPYYIQYPLSLSSGHKENPMLHKYYLYRLIQKNRIKNVYLARNLENGYFYSIKVYRCGLQMGQHQARFLHAINQQMKQKIPQYMKNQQFSNFSFPYQSEYTVIPRVETYMIPSEEQQDQSQQQKQKSNNDYQQDYKHLAIAYAYNIRGKLSDRINDKNRITQKQLLKYLKQLVWIAYSLHEEYNIIHRNLTPQSLEIDQLGDIKLINFTSWLECYNQQGNMIQYPLNKRSHNIIQFQNSSSRIYEEEFEGVEDGWFHIGHYTPPQVENKSRQGYNKFVDYYTIGIIIKQLYEKAFEFNKNQNSNKAKLVQEMIQRLTSTNLKQREQIVLQIVQGIKKSKAQETQRKNKQISLNLSDIRLGSQISLQNNISCVENQDNDLQFNGISHQQIINYFKPLKLFKQANKQQSGSNLQIKINKDKKKTKDTLKVSRGQLTNVSNSRQKSVKSLKSNKSKDKSRTKSKLSNQKKSKSKSQKKTSSSGHERNSINNNLNVSNGTSKLTRTNVYDIPSPINQKKQKSKSREKIKIEKSPQKYSTEKKLKDINSKLHTQTLVSGIKYQSNVFHKTLNKTGEKINIPLPKQHKSPHKHF